MNFDQPSPRVGTDAFKWKKYAGKDILPMWVADTEFRCADPILEAVQQEVNSGILGYTLPSQHTGANNAVMRWLKDKHGWAIEPEWIVWMPGVVPAFNVACKALATSTHKVIVQTPNYPPLLAAPQLHNAERLDVPTVLVNGRWTLDFNILEQHASDPDCHLFIMCNPMNPVGSAMTQEELSRVADICTRHQVTLCSDEIHCDLILTPGIAHIPAGKMPALTDNSITLMAASKTFNVAGLGAAFAIIPNATLRRRFTQAAQGMVPWVNILGLVATEAAFTLCDEWHQSLLHYLRGNREYLVDAVSRIDGLTAQTPDATFLLWVDASGLGVDDTQKWCESRGVGPSPGADFGNRDFFRLNFGCARDDLKLAIKRLSTGV
ncbi:MalY/PatB family protein [Alteromonas facilis]|uniref:MalY/PatB family protein n=1 Tax=Alteromonas facilis TaxID=2048004 RepID=UPI000C28815D|nr:PatB family C-S lyase [Alteromonas facilis]